MHNRPEVNEYLVKANQRGRQAYPKGPGGAYGRPPRSGSLHKCRPGYARGWPLHAILLLQSFCAASGSSLSCPFPCACPHYCNTIARRLRNIRPPTPLVYAIHHTKLVLAISCKGQARVHRRFIIQRGHEHTRTGN